RRPFAPLLVLGGHRRSGRRPGDRMDSRPAGLDRARHRPRAQPDTRPRPGGRQRLHGARRSADGRTGLPPSAAAALERARPQVPIDARVQEPDDARHAGGDHGTRRASGSARAVRREGSRSGTAAAGDAGRGERRLRRRRRPHRRSPDHAGEDHEGAGSEGRRQAGPLRARQVPRNRLARAAARAAAVGRRRWAGGHRHGTESRMMRLPYFRFESPRTVAEAAELLARAAPGEAMLVAGGTDLLPNMKRRQQVPQTLIGLRRVAGLREIANGDGLHIGAGVTLTDLVRDHRVRRKYGALWQAASRVATPQLRNMGTLGGNLCLDTRCNYYDQNYEWRKTIDFCMKKDDRAAERGAPQVCWVATSSPRCLAVSSTDTAPALIALDAQITLVSADGSRQIAAADLFQNDGIH